jgi:hypothetical protein
MAKVKRVGDWGVLQGRTKTVYDVDTGAPSEEVVSPWMAEWLGANGTARIYNATEAGLNSAIEAHPFTLNPPAAPQIATNAGVSPDPGSLEARVAALEAASK